MKKTKTPSFVTIAVFTTITVAIWIAFGVYRVVTAKPETLIPEEILKPFSADFNSEAIDTLQEKLYFTREQTEGLTVPSPSATPLISPTPTPTPSPTPGAGLDNNENGDEPVIGEEEI